MGRRGRKHQRDGRKTRDMARTRFREDFETDANRSSRSTFKRVFLLKWSGRSRTREYFLPWLIQSVQYKRIFFALTCLVGPVQENISCFGQSSRSGTREYIRALACLVGLIQENIVLPWLVQSVQYKRMFSLQVETQVSFSYTATQAAWQVSKPFSLYLVYGEHHRCSLFLQNYINCPRKAAFVDAPVGLFSVYKPM